jgi:hypothetical protein
MIFTHGNSRQPSPPPASQEASIAGQAPVPADFKRLTLQDQLEVLMHANPHERQLLKPIFNERYQRDIDKVPEDERELFFRNLAAAGLLEVSRNPPAVKQGSDSLDVLIAKAEPARAAVPPSAQPKDAAILTESGTKSTNTPVQASNAIDPCVNSSSTRQPRPPNGHESAYEGVVQGFGKLTIINGNSEDAAVILASSAPQNPDRLIYIRAGMEATLTEIPPGQYRVKFQIGKIWDPEAEVFQCVLATAIFDQEDTFEEEKTETGVQYSDVHLTLHKVVGGNVRTTPMDRSAFRRRVVR